MCTGCEEKWDAFLQGRKEVIEELAELLEEDEDYEEFYNSVKTLVDMER